jgi:hypothetical protein
LAQSYCMKATDQAPEATSNEPLPATREIAIRLLPACRCGHSRTGKWPDRAGADWIVVKSQEPAPPEAALIEYECVACRRRYRLRGNKLQEVLPDGSERPYMREGRYGRWLSCR